MAPTRDGRWWLSAMGVLVVAALGVAVAPVARQVDSMTTAVWRIKVNIRVSVGRLMAKLTSDGW